MTVLWPLQSMIAGACGVAVMLAGASVAQQPVELASVSHITAVVQQEPPVELTTPDGRKFEAIPDGEHYRVPTDIDPEGVIQRQAPSGRVQAQQADVPSCVQIGRSENNQQQLFAANMCANDVRVKFLVAFGPDSECNIIPPNRSVFFTMNPIGRFDGAVSC